MQLFAEVLVLSQPVKGDLEASFRPTTGPSLLNMNGTPTHQAGLQTSQL
jgi:hypothetical protein